MKSADDGNLRIPQGLGEIVGSENQIAGTLSRAEEGNRCDLQEVEVSVRAERRGRACSKELYDGSRITGISVRDCCEFHAKPTSLEIIQVFKASVCSRNLLCRKERRIFVLNDERFHGEVKAFELRQSE